MVLHCCLCLPPPCLHLPPYPPPPRRTIKQCWFFGLHEGRWARTVYATSAGQEYMCLPKLCDKWCETSMRGKIAGMGE